LKIKIKLAKDPADYAVYNSNKKIGMVLGVKAGNFISYFKIDGDNEKGGVSTSPKKVGICN